MIWPPGTISTADCRDGWDIIDIRDVKITNINVSSNDDALVFKSDWRSARRSTA